VLEVCRQLVANLGNLMYGKNKWDKWVQVSIYEQRVLRDENGRLKKLAADLTLDKHILREVLSKKITACSLAGFYCIDARILRNRCEAYL
jgi:putative transposase